MANLTLDVDDNTIGLIEKLANQLGVTADKIYLLYVNQSILDGYTTIATIIIFAFLGFLFLYIGNKNKKLYKSSDNINVILPYILGTVISFFVLINGSEKLGESYMKIKNPEYYAIKNIAKDIGKMNGNTSKGE